MGTTGASEQKPWTGILASNWANWDKAVILSDMTRFVPPEACSSRLKQGAWRVFPYEAGGIQGNLIWAFEDNRVPKVRVPLPVNGWYAIFVGRLCVVPGGKTQVWLKLDGQRASIPRSTKVDQGYWNIQDIFYKVAELKDQCLEISQTPGGIIHRCSVAYIKLIPLSEAEISGFLADRDNPTRRSLAASCDGFSFIYERRPTTEEELLSEVEIYRDTDFKTLLLHLGGSDQVNYPSKFGFMFGQDIDSFPEAGDRYFVEAVRELARKKINPTKVLIDGAHDIGMKVHVGFRPALWSYYPPYTDLFESPFYRRHPEWRTIDKDGTPVARMSWAVPEVRAHLLDVLREAVELGADGVHIVFNRGFPMVLYEPAFCELFRKQYGEDPHALDESDPRIQKLRSDVVITFMKEVRDMLDREEGWRGNGKRLEISVCVLGDEADNLRYAVDLRRMVREGLVDEIHAYKYGFGETKRTWDMKFFREVRECGKVRIFPMLNIFEPLANHLNDIKTLFADGADGICLWDAFTDNISWWSAICRFGRPEEFELRMRHASEKPLSLPVHRIGNEILDGRFPIFWGG